MNLNFDQDITDFYSSKSQIARVLTENWVKNNGYCPSCGEILYKFENNRPVADFLCKNCEEEFELKSKNSSNVGKKIIDGAYATMINRITSENNPNFFFLAYDKNKLKVVNFLIIPKFYFLPAMIEKRKPLSSHARRAGWIGCNIDLSKIPHSGRIYIVKNSEVIPRKVVKNNWIKTSFLKNRKLESKGWIMDIMNCIDSIKSETFSLSDIYAFESLLKRKHPQNNFIKDKIRQQLQLLRDKNIIEFKARGIYKKVTL